MTTILRSSKYIRCLNLFARRIILDHDNSKLVKKSFEIQARCASSYLTNRSYATRPAVQRNNERAPSFEVLFAKLDENIQRYGRVFKMEVDALLAKARDTGYISSLDGLLLIRCCGNLLVDVMPQDRNKLVDEIWNTLDILKTPLDVSHFNALLRVYLDNNYEFSPIEFLTSMRDKGAEPNRITYQRLMLSYCKRGDIEGATKILEVMKEKGLPLNEAVFSALITGHSEAGDLASAKNMINVMKEAGVEPSSGTYAALLNAYAKRGDMAALKETINEFNTKNLYLQDADYFEFIQTLAANDHTEEVEQILAMMPKGATYNLDATHAILKVLDVGNVNVALKILSTMKRSKRFDEDPSAEGENGIFLIRKLVNAKYPADQIIEACEALQYRGENVRAFSIAVERSLLNGDTKLSIPLLEGWKRNGGTIREHYFWPLFVAHGKAGNYQGILDIVKEMTTKFDIVPNLDTVKEYILPFTAGKWVEVVSSLRELRIPHATIVGSIASRMLTDNKIRKTAYFMLSYPMQHNPEQYYRPLTDAVLVTGDAASYASILRILISGGTDHDGQTSSSVDTVDSAIKNLLENTPAHKYSTVEKILEHLVENGLSMSPETGVAIRDFLTDNVDPMTDDRIEKLTSCTLTPLPLDKLGEKLGSEDLEGSNRSQWNTNTDGKSLKFVAKRRELTAAIQNHDSAAVQDITQTLESLNFTFSPALNAQIIDAFCKADNLEMAEKWMKKTRRENPNIMFDIQKATSYAALLIKHGRFDDAVNFILESPRNNDPQTYPMGSKFLVKALLDAAAETGDVERTNKLFDALIKSNYLAVDNFVLGPLIKVHMARNDFASALDAFETACKTHHCTPMKNELSKKFIDTEDAKSLQRLTDLSTEIHGENNSLIDLVLSFVECGRFRQARKILETPGLRLRGKKLATVIQRYVEEDANDYLDQFVDLTKGLPVVDRQDFYNLLMIAHSKKNNWQRGLNLWTTIQDEDVQPSNTFLKILAELLKRNQQPVPFAYNNYEQAVKAEGQPDAHTFDVRDFYEAIEAKDVQKAENILKSIPSDHPEFSSAISVLIVEYIEGHKNVIKAGELAEQSILQHGRIPRAHALKAIWQGYIDNNEFEKLKQQSNILGASTRQRLRFYKYLSRASLKEMGVSKFIENFKANLEQPGVDRFQTVRESLHFSTLIEEFKKDSSQVASFHSLAEDLVKENIFLPINLVWCYYFEQNDPQADVVWVKHLSKSPRVLYKHIVTASKNNNDVKLAERLYQTISTNPEISENAKLFVVTNLIDLYNTNGRTEEALKVVEDLNPSEIKAWTRTHPIVANKFRESIEAAGKSLPHNLDDTRRASADALV